MNIIEPYAKLVGPDMPTDPFSEADGIRLLRRIEYFGRFSHATEEAQTPESWRRFIPAVVMGHGDWSIVEHATATVDMLVDRGITHEVVRHRLFSFTQSSTRFINYAKKMPPSFIEPPGLTDDAARAGNGEQVELSTRQLWRHAISTSESSYRDLLAAGFAPQIARSVFPNALASRIAVTGNLRNWRLFLLMRTTKEAHPQMRRVTIPLLAEFKLKIPLLFDDIQPESRQIDNLRLPR